MTNQSKDYFSKLLVNSKMTKKQVAVYLDDITLRRIDKTIEQLGVKGFSRNMLIEEAIKKFLDESQEFILEEIDVDINGEVERELKKEMGKITRKSFVTSDGKKVFIFSSTYKKTTFEALLKEYTEKGYVTWGIEGTGSRKMEAGDICYIKYTNLPSVDDADDSRMLLRGTVLEGAVKMKKSDIYFHEDENDNVGLAYGFKIENLQPINMNDPVKYSNDNLKNHYGLTTHIQSVQQLYEDCKALYEDIEEDIRLNPNQELKDLVEYMSVNTI